jgi:tetratricopeptide (TPR) repeat protein
MSMKNVFALIIVAVLNTAFAAVCAAQPTMKPPSMEKMIDTKATSRMLYNYSRARMEALEGNLDGALVILQEAVRQDPRSAFLHKKIAEICKITNRKTAECDKALSYDPDYRPAHMLAGIIEAALGDDKEAIVHFKRAKELDPSKEDAYINLAVSYVKTFEYEGAVNTLKELVKVSPDSAIGYYYLGKTYDQMKLYNKASEYFKKALELNPDFEQAMIDLALPGGRDSMTRQ